MITSRGGSFDYVSASDLLNGRVAADHLKGKLVLVGINLSALRMHALLLPLAAWLVLATLIYFGTTAWGCIVESRSRRSLARLFGTRVTTAIREQSAGCVSRANNSP